MPNANVIRFTDEFISARIFKKASTANRWADTCGGQLQRTSLTMMDTSAARGRSLHGGWAVYVPGKGYIR